MPTINQLQNVNIRDLVDRNKNVKPNDAETGIKQKDFGETISEFVQAVNDDQTKSAKEVSDVVQGKSQNLHQAMASMEEAKLSFQLMIEIRNKLLESYKEVQRMQV